MPPFECPKFVYSNEHLLGILSQFTKIESPHWLDEINELMSLEPQKCLLLTTDENIMKNFTHHNNANKFKSPGNHPTSNHYSNIGVNEDSSRYKSKKWGSFEFTEQSKKDHNEVDDESDIKKLKEKSKSYHSFDETFVAEVAATDETETPNNKLLVAKNTLYDSDNRSYSTDKETVGRVEKQRFHSSRRAIDESSEDHTLETASTIMKTNEQTNFNSVYFNSRPSYEQAYLSVDNEDEARRDTSLGESKKPYSNRASPSDSNKKPYTKNDNGRDESSHLKSVRGKPCSDFKNRCSNHSYATKNAYSSSHGSTSIIMNYNSNASSTPSSTTTSNYVNGNKRYNNHYSYNHTTSNVSDKKLLSQQPPEQHLLATKNRPATSKQRPRPKSCVDSAQNIVHMKKNQSTECPPEPKEPILTIDEIMREQMAEKLAEEKKKRQQLHDKARKKKESAACYGGVALTKPVETVCIEQIELEEKAKSLSIKDGSDPLGNPSTLKMENHTVNSDGKFWDSAMKFF